MSLQQYMFLIRKSHTHSHLLMNISKNITASFFPSKSMAIRTFKKGTAILDTKQPDLLNEHLIAGEELGKDLTLLSKMQEKSATQSLSATEEKRKLKKGGSSAAAKKYFQKSFFDKYPSLLEEDKKRDVRLGDFGSLGNKNNKNKDSGNLKDERDPNERLSEIFSEDVDETRDRRLNFPLTREGRIGKNAYYYTRKMSIYGRQGKIKEAISVFEHWMMLRDRVMPNKRTFTVLIGILGRVGYTDKAFELYLKMRNLGLDPPDQVYTGLFNACANSPWPRKSLKQAENLLSSLQSKGIQLNLITLKAASKAMAFCGNFPRAFTIMDEASTYMSLDAEAFDHLLMACIADKQKGFSRALQVWQKMGEFNVQPQTTTFNLLIRSARDCGIGDPDDFAKVLGLSDGKSKLFVKDNFLKSGQSKQLESQTSSAAQMRLNAREAGSRGKQHLPADSSSLSRSIGLLSHDNARLDTPEHTVSKHEHHNLFHDIPNFDRDMEEFLMQREAEREKSGLPDLYEWWEDHPTDVQQQLDKQLSQEGGLDWPDRELNQGMSEGELEALANMDNKDNNFVPQTVCIEMVADTVEGVPKTEGQLSDFPQKTQAIFQASPSEPENHSKALIVKDVTTPVLRLALLGGARKLVTHMSETGATPDVRTFSQLVPGLPSSEQAEDDLLQLMQDLGVVPDVDLINDLMLKRNLRHDGDSAKALLQVMSKFGLVPNMRTYAALALTCLKEYQAHNLLRDMKAANLEPNSEVMGHFIYISRSNFSYKLHMLQKMEWMGLSPKPETISVIEKSIAIIRKNIIKAEKQKDKNNHYLTTEYQESFQRFLNFYKGWLQRNTLHQTHHPWSAFQRKNTSTDEAKDDEIKTAT